MSDQIKLSVAVISRNEEHIIGDMIESALPVADEIIIVDSGSTDKTIEIASSLGANVFEEEWKGYAAQKNSALEKCTGQWILFLDCDEILSPELRFSIKKAIDSDKIQSYYLSRKTSYLGKILNHAWQPDRQLRLVHKSAMPRWTGSKVHEKLEVHGEKAVLKGDLIHYSYRNLQDHFQRTIKYAKLRAEDYQQKGRDAGLCDIIANPFIAFIRSFFIRKAFLDGARGFLAAASSVFYTFLKYAFLFEMGLKNNKGLPDEKD